MLWWTLWYIMIYYLRTKVCYVGQYGMLWYVTLAVMVCNVGYKLMYSKNVWYVTVDNTVCYVGLYGMLGGQKI